MHADEQMKADAWCMQPGWRRVVVWLVALSVRTGHMHALEKGVGLACALGERHGGSVGRAHGIE